MLSDGVRHCTWGQRCTWNPSTTLTHPGVLGLSEMQPPLQNSNKSKWLKQMYQRVTVCERTSSVQRCVCDPVLRVSFLFSLSSVFGVIAKNQVIWVLVTDLEQVTSPCSSSVPPSIMKQFSQGVYILTLGFSAGPRPVKDQKSTEGENELTPGKGGLGLQSKRSGKTSLG